MRVLPVLTVVAGLVAPGVALADCTTAELNTLANDLARASTQWSMMPENQSSSRISTMESDVQRITADARARSESQAPAKAAAPGERPHDDYACMVMRDLIQYYRMR